MMHSRHLHLSIAALVVLTLSLQTKEREQPKKIVDFDETIYNWSRTFAEALHISGEKHYKVQDPQECMVQAIDAYLNCLDPHSSFLDPKTYKKIMESTSGEFFGVGIVIDNTRSAKDKHLTIINTIPGGPSEKAGVQSQDKIVEIDGKQLEGMSTEEATALLKGERNTKVKVKILREGHPDLITFTITRDVVKEQSSLCFYLPKQNIYYLSLTTFAENSHKQLAKLIKESAKKEYKGLVLDLRNNSGGLLVSAVDICGLFIDKGSLVVETKGKDDQEIEEYKTTTDPIANSTLPIVILINNYTASAGEILCGCLKIYSEKLAQEAARKNEPQKKLMVFLVGTKTFGKGSVQEIIPASNNCAFKLTTALYYLPDGNTIQGKGIEPDFTIERSFPPPERVVWFTQHHGRERTLKGTIKAHKESKDNQENDKPDTPNNNSDDDMHKTWAERMHNALNQDNQFKSAISLINLLDTAKNSIPESVSNRIKAVNFLQQNYIDDEKLEMEEVSI